MSLKIFISYSTNDFDVVEKLRATLLSEPGVKLYVADFDAPPGALLAQNINDNLRESDIFCVLWSRNAKESNWVQQEIGLAHAREKLIVPIVLDKDTQVPGFIQDRKYIKAYDGLEKALTSMSQYVRQVIEQRSAKAKDEESNTLAFLGLLALVLLVLSSGGKK
jgi:hypothetical protein